MIRLIVKENKFKKFLKKLNDNNINIYKINKNTIIVDEKDLERINKIKTIYGVEIDDYVGIKKVIKNINYIFIFSIIISFVFIIVNSNIIYKINIITDDIEVKNIIKKEIRDYDIKIHSFKKKNYDIIEKNIIKNNKNKIEWIEIEDSGTTINIKVQTRKIKNKEKIGKPRNIIAKKNAIIKRINAKYGDVLKENNIYVNKGDIIISGNISFNNISKNIEAKGDVYGEVWYKVKTSVSYNDFFIKKTNELKKVIKIDFLNKHIYLTKNKYKYKKEKEVFKISCLFLPIRISLVEQNKIIKKWTVLTEEEVINKAKELSRKKINNKLKDKEYIIFEKQLKQIYFNSKIEVEMFFAVYENITDYSFIE